MKKTRILLLALVCFGLTASTAAQEQVDFRKVVEDKLAKIRWGSLDGKAVPRKFEEVCAVDTDSVAKRVFADYGAIFVAKSDTADGVLFPFECIFASEAEVQHYQTQAKTQHAMLGGVWIELQKAAMSALLEAQKDAAKVNLKITPRGGSEAGKRSYADTERLWKSRFFPALNHWVAKGRISARDADAARKKPINEQVAQVLEWEDKHQLWFSKDLSKSILYSVAAPGASQHIFMLAIDVEQFANKRVREILAARGWWQTVKSDLPHFTYLGVTKEEELRKLGLIKTESGGQEFWIPNWK